MDDLVKRLSAAIEAEERDETGVRRGEASRRILAEHTRRDSRCVRCVAHPASTDQWIGVGVGASFPCETVIALAYGYGIEEQS